MTHRETLYRGVSHAAWGYFFLYFHITLGTINLLPAFVGYLLFLSSIKLLAEERRDLALLRPLGIFLMLWNLLDWGAKLIGATLGGHFVVLELLMRLAELYFHFQLLTDFAALAEKYQGKHDVTARKIYRWRTIYTVLMTVFPLVLYIREWIPEGWISVGTVFMIVMLIAGIRLMALMFSLRKLFAQGAPQMEEGVE